MSAGRPVTVVDYGAGNLLNVVRALQYCGAEVNVTDQPVEIMEASRVVFPGVGAFGECMSTLHAKSLANPLKLYAESGRPFLGICIGMQVLFEKGEEFGEHAGLGILPGRVIRIPTGKSGKERKVPHIGWANLHPAAGVQWEDSLLKDARGKAFYFVHSFMAMPGSAQDTFAEADYNGISICAAVRRGNLYGVQFHPEKSGEAGLDILRNFLSI